MIKRLLPAGLAALCLRGDHDPDGVRSARTAYIMVACFLAWLVAWAKDKQTTTL